MVILRRLLLLSGSFPISKNTNPRWEGLTGTPACIYLWVHECVMKTLAGWKFAMETHFWINRRKLGHMTRKEKAGLNCKSLNSIILGSVMCVFQEYSPLPAWKMFHSLTLLLRAYVLTFSTEDLTKHVQRPMANISILLKQKQETVFLNMLQKKHFKLDLDAVQKSLYASFHM